MVVSASFSDNTARPSYASLGRRIAAYLIDIVLFFAVWILVAITMQLLRATEFWIPAVGGGNPQNTWAALNVSSKLLVVLAYVVPLGPFHFILFHASSWQATFGKRLPASMLPMMLDSRSSCSQFSVFGCCDLATKHLPRFWQIGLH